MSQIGNNEARLTYETDTTDLPLRDACSRRHRGCAFRKSTNPNNWYARFTERHHDYRRETTPAATNEIWRRAQG
jgi:hypothetical protein